MTNSTLRVGFSLAISLATTGAAVAQQSGPTPQVTSAAGKVQQTMVRLSDSDTLIERFWVDRKVNYADLDLTTASGSAELKRRITEAAKEACAQVHTANPDLSATDDGSCIKTATNNALKQANAAIAASASG